MKHRAHAKLLPGLGPEHVDSVKAIRALRARGAAGLFRLANLAEKSIADLASAHIKDVERWYAERLRANAAGLDELTRSRAVNEYIVEKASEFREGLAALQTTLSGHVRGFLPPGHQASWRRGLGVERPRSVWV